MLYDQFGGTYDGDGPQESATFDTAGDAVVYYRSCGFELQPQVTGEAGSDSMIRAYLDGDRPGWDKIAFMLSNGSEVFGHFRKLP